MARPSKAFATRCARSLIVPHLVSESTAISNSQTVQHLHLLDKSTHLRLGQHVTGVAKPGGDEDAQRFDQLNAPTVSCRTVLGDCYALHMTKRGGS